MKPTERIVCDTCGLRFYRYAEYTLDSDDRPQCADVEGCNRRYQAYLNMRRWLAEHWADFARVRETRFPSKYESDLYV